MRKNYTKPWMAVGMAAAVALTLAGCNTIAGFGRDVERGGEKVQDASLKVRADWRAARRHSESEYDEARRRCDTGSVAERDACRDRARVQYSAGVNQARTTYRRSEMKSVSEAERLEDQYEAARDRCNAMRGADEDRCIDDARRRYLR
ncbi:MAG: entericidin A/B family lipoprotein [Casimicrobiaceae bacterium]